MFFVVKLWKRLGLKSVRREPLGNHQFATVVLFDFQSALESMDRAFHLVI